MSLKSFVIDTSINRYLFFYLMPLRKQNYHLNYSLNVFLAVVYIIYKDHILKAFRPLQYLHFMSTWKFALDEWVFLNTCLLYLYFKTFERFISQKKFNFSFRHNENIITDDKPLPGMIELKPCP